VKILVLAPHPFFQARGTPLAVKTVLEFLSARGHHMDVLTFHEGEDVDIPNCRIHRIARPLWVRNVRPGFSTKKVICDVFMFAKCLRMMRGAQYDLIHAVEEGAFIAAAMRRISGTPYVYDMDSSLAEQLVETYPMLQFAFSTLRRLEALAVRQSLGVLTVCAALEDVAQGHAPGKTVGRVEDASLLPSAETHSGNGQPADPLMSLGVKPESLVAMYVGNLERYQGIDLLLDGFQYTLVRLPSARLVIVGGLNEEVNHYQRRANHLGISEQVHFMGPRPISALDALLRRADVLVSPRLKGLNTPMKIYSYLDSGTAVLATRLRTHTQVLDDRIAYLVEPEPYALGEGLAHLLKDPGLRSRLASEAKAYVQQEFTPEAAQRKLDSFYSMMETKTAGATE
jgi:glycosyltransferase involved in cell wall biosynthesis